MKGRIFALLILAASIFAGCGKKASKPEACLPVPTQKQLDWHEMEFYAFVHFTTNTFTNKEWGFGDESPEVFNPTEFDARQWARVAKEAGMKGIILTAKHHDGFCLWPTKYNEHNLTKSPWKDGKGDVVKEVSEACKEYGLKFGLYLSPWDRNHAEYGREGYVTYFRNQLEELLTNYGDVFEMWFDGANGGSGYYGGANENRKINTLTYYNWDETYKLIRKISPKTLVWGIGPAESRWIGNERGIANPTNWSMLRQKDDLAGKVRNKEYMSGHIDGEKWVPGEADVSIRPGWFYHKSEDDKVRSLEDMVDIYYTSVGRNANLLLNLPVDRRGLVHENDEARLKELVDVLKADFKENILKNAEITASNERGNDSDYKAENVNDGDKETYWATDDAVKAASLTLEFDEAKDVNRLLLQEYITLGQRVKEFTVEAKVDGNWVEVASETTIGYKRILRFKKVNATALRVNIIDSRACPLISNVEAFNAPAFIRSPKIKRNSEGTVLLEANHDVEIYYTVDGSKPSKQSTKYNGEFSFTDAGVIKAISYNKDADKYSQEMLMKCSKTKSSWKVLSVSNGPMKKAYKIIDGDPQNIFNSDNEEVFKPVVVKIDMGETQKIKGFSYMPRQKGHSLNLIANYDFYTSLDQKNWKKVSSGEFSNIKNNPIQQFKYFNSTKARYLKFVAKTTADGTKRISIGELDVIN